MSKHAVILAGGLGTRLQPIVRDRPKALAPVRSRPFLAYLLDWLERANFTRVILCVGHLAEQIKETFGDTYATLALTYSYEPEPRGTAGALRLALNQIDDELCLVLNGDSFVDADLTAFLDWHRQHIFAGSILLTHVDNTARFGLVETGNNGSISAFLEKQETHSAGYINAGVYLLSRQLLESIPNDLKVSIEHECFPQWLSLGLGGYRTQARFIDIGTPESLHQAEAFFASYHTS